MGGPAGHLYLLQPPVHAPEGEAGRVQVAQAGGHLQQTLRLRTHQSGDEALEPGADMQSWSDGGQ